MSLYLLCKNPTSRKRKCVNRTGKRTIPVQYACHWIPYGSMGFIHGHVWVVPWQVRNAHHVVAVRQIFCTARVRIENNRHFRDSRTKGVQRRMTLHLDKAHATGRAISRISRIQQHSRKKIPENIFSPGTSTGLISDKTSQDSTFAVVPQAAAGCWHATCSKVERRCLCLTACARYEGIPCRNRKSICFPSPEKTASCT
jgi:hypothetical protein